MTVHSQFQMMRIGPSDVRDRLIPLLFDDNEAPREFILPAYNFSEITDDIALIYVTVTGRFNALISNLPHKLKYVNPLTLHLLNHRWSISRSKESNINHVRKSKGIRLV